MDSGHYGQLTGRHLAHTQEELHQANEQGNMADRQADCTKKEKNVVDFIFISILILLRYFSRKLRESFIGGGTQYFEYCRNLEEA